MQCEGLSCVFFKKKIILLQVPEDEESIPPILEYNSHMVGKM